MPNAFTPEQALHAARGHHAAGDLEAARAMYRRVLELTPGHPDALAMLGSIAYQSGDDDEAAAAQVDAAIAGYRRMLLRAPDGHAIRAALANLLLARGHAAEAEAVIAKAQFDFVPVRATAAEFEARRRAAKDRGLPPILINAVPKSASESIWNRIAAGLGMAQGHISLGLFPDCLAIPHRVRGLAGGGVAAKEHMPATPYNLTTLAAGGVDRVVVHLRDPRQSTLSWAHFLEGDVRSRLLAPLWRKTTPGAALFRLPFEAQIDWHIDSYLPIVMDFVDGWVAAGEASDNAVAVAFLSFETFKRDPGAYFGEVLAFHGIDPAAFADDANAEVIHLRKGAVDEWREVFTPEQQERAWQRIPPHLAERFGWRR